MPRYRLSKPARTKCQQADTQEVLTTLFLHHIQSKHTYYIAPHVTKQSKAHENIIHGNNQQLESNSAC